MELPECEHMRQRKTVQLKCNVRHSSCKETTRERHVRSVRLCGKNGRFLYELQIMNWIKLNDKQRKVKPYRDNHGQPNRGTSEWNRGYSFSHLPSLSVQSIELIGVNNLTDSVKKINTNTAIELNMMIVVEWDGILLNNLENFNTFSCLDIGRSVQIVNRHAITSTFYTSFPIYLNKITTLEFLDCKV